MERKIKGTAYGLVLFFITLTGFAQMPIFKRYYIADIPGLGWLAQFYVTHSLHYIFAAVLIGWGVFVLLDLMLNGKGLFSVTGSGMVKAVLILGLMVSGGFMVVRKFARGVFFPWGHSCDESDPCGVLYGPSYGISLYFGGREKMDSLNAVVRILI